MKYNIIIISIKIFLRYLNINLFNRKINFFDIIIIKNKLKIINEIIYLNIFNDLEYYLRLTSYLRSLICYYAKFIDLL